MKAGRRQGDQRVAGLYTFSVEQALALDHADDEAGHVVFTGGIEAGHLGGFAADQCATGLAAGAAHAIDQLLDDLRLELAHSKVVEKEKRLGALHQNVVDAMIHQVAADGGMNAHGHGDFQLGADTVRAGNQDGLFPFFGVQGEEAAKTANAAENAGRKGAAGVMANSLLGVVSDGDVYSSVCVFHGSPVCLETFRNNSRTAHVQLTDDSRTTYGQITDTLTKAKLTVRSDYNRGGRGVMLQLKYMKQSLPAHAAGMQDGIGVGEKALTDLTRFPGVGRRVERHVDHHGRTNYILARDA